MNNHSFFAKTIKFVTVSLLTVLLHVSGFAFFYTFNPPILSVRASSDISSIDIEHLPYVTTFSLGDTLEYPGLSLLVTYSDTTTTTITSGFSLEGGNNLQLGKQTIFVNYQNQLTSFDIDVTNQGAITKVLVANDIFISEIISLNDDLQAIEIFNGTDRNINLSDYQLQITDLSNQTVTYDFTIDTVLSYLADSTYVIANEMVNSDTVDQVELAFSLIATKTISLYHKETNQAIDIIRLDDSSITDGTQNGVADLVNLHLVRGPKITSPTSIFNWKHWRISDSLVTLGQHSMQTPQLSVEQQAISYGEYIMYGIGMNAASDYFNVFYELRDEFNALSNETKQYFLTNKAHPITGINEGGREVTNTFNDAIGRYNYLASKTGNPGLTGDRLGIAINWEQTLPIIIMGAIIVFAGAVYVFFRIKFFRN